MTFVTEMTTSSVQATNGAGSFTIKFMDFPLRIPFPFDVPWLRKRNELTVPEVVSLFKVVGATRRMMRDGVMTW
jgi:hypothetical protein